MAFTKNEEAVSPVIGVILMVAITVILAAVIAAFVFGMAGNISKTKVVACTAAKTSSDRITVTNNGGQDQASLSAINVTTSVNAASCWVDGASKVLEAGTFICKASNPKVGDSIGLIPAAGAYAGRVEVVAVGWFNDGTQQVLLDTFV